MATTRQCGLFYYICTHKLIIMNSEFEIFPFVKSINEQEDFCRYKS